MLETPAYKGDAMPIPPDQLPELQPTRVGKFLGLYGITVVTCNNPAEEAEPSARKMASSEGDSAQRLEGINADVQDKIDAHRAYHEIKGTTPCIPNIGPVSAIYRSPEGAGVGWVPLKELEAFNP